MVEKRQPVPASVLLEQLEEDIRLLASSSEVQLQWTAIHKNRLEEMVLQLYDSLHSFEPRLRDSQLIDLEDEESLRNLEEYLRSRTDRELFSELDAVRDDPQWERIRELAGFALVSLQRPLEEKHLPKTKP